MPSKAAVARKAKPRVPRKPADLIAKEKALEASEAALRAKLEGVMKRAPDSFLAVYLDLVDRMVRGVRARVETLEWFQAVVRDTLTKAKP